MADPAGAAQGAGAMEEDPPVVAPAGAQAENGQPPVAAAAPIIDDETRAAVDKSEKSLKGNLATYDGSSDANAWLELFAFQMLLRGIQESTPAFMLLFLRFLGAKPLKALLTRFAQADLIACKVSWAAICDVLRGHFGRSKEHTNFSAREALLALRVKRAADGNFDVAGYLQSFQRMAAQCPDRPDDKTLVWMMHRQLPPQLRALANVDPTTGKAFADVNLFVNYVLAQSAVVAANKAAGDVKSPGASQPQSPSQKRVKFAQAAGPPKSHAGKASFVPGRTAKEISAMKKRGECFHCGEKGHKAQDCKSTK